MTKGDIRQLLIKSFRSHPPPAGADLVSDKREAATTKAIRDLFAGRWWDELDPEFVKFLDALTPIEKSAIRAFLEYTAADHPSEGERRVAKLTLNVLWPSFVPIPVERDCKTD